MASTAAKYRSADKKSIGAGPGSTSWSGSAAEMPSPNCVHGIDRPKQHVLSPSDAIDPIDPMRQAEEPSQDLPSQLEPRVQHEHVVLPLSDPQRSYAGRGFRRRHRPLQSQDPCFNAMPCRPVPFFACFRTYQLRPGPLGAQSRRAVGGKSMRPLTAACPIA